MSGNKPTVTVTFTIPALDTYTVSYSANGKTLSNSLPASQTKQYGGTLTLSAIPPTTVGYTCTCWVTAAPDNKVYPFGSNYTANANTVLYANWVPNSRSILYDTNGGSGGPVGQTISYDSISTIPSEIPIRQNYNFLGWSLSQTSSEPEYAAGASYSFNEYLASKPTSALTLYAVWELAYIPPIISNVNVQRCDEHRNDDDDGEYINVSFDWLADTSRVSGVTKFAISIDGPAVDGSEIEDRVYTIGATINGSYNSKDDPPDHVPLGGKIVDETLTGLVSTENNYTVTITVYDAIGSNSTSRTIFATAYPIDVLAEGKGVSFGGPAKKEGVAEFKFTAEFNKPIILGDEARLSLLNIFYPVGSIYISYTEGFSPETSFGGTWERIKGRFLYGEDDDNIGQFVTIRDVVNYLETL